MFRQVWLLTILVEVKIQHAYKRQGSMKRSSCCGKVAWCTDEVLLNTTLGFDFRQEI